MPSAFGIYYFYLFIYIFLTFGRVKKELVQSSLQSVRRGQTHSGGGTVPSVIKILAVKPPTPLNIGQVHAIKRIKSC